MPTTTTTVTVFSFATICRDLRKGRLQRRSSRKSRRMNQRVVAAFKRIARCFHSPQRVEPMDKHDSGANFYVT